MDKNHFGEGTTVIWTDKKRILGMPISFTRYSLVTNGDWTKLFIKTGVLSTVIDEVNLFRIYDIQCFQSLGQKMFNVGSITLYSKDITTPVISLTNIKEPYKIRNMLAQKIEQTRTEKGVRIGEFY